MFLLYFQPIRRFYLGGSTWGGESRGKSHIPLECPCATNNAQCLLYSGSLTPEQPMILNDVVMFRRGNGDSGELKSLSQGLTVTSLILRDLCCVL